MIWTADEQAILRALYPLHKWREILDALPTRRVDGIRSKAYELGLRRATRFEGVAQIEPSDFELGYLCGILDGEGSIALAVQPKQGSRFGNSYTLNVTVSNTNRELIEYVRRICGDLSRAINYVRKDPRVKPNMSYRITLGALRRLLPRIQLVAKKRQLAVIKTLLETAKPYEHRDQKLNNEWKRAYEELRVLNRRGVIDR